MDISSVRKEAQAYFQPFLLGNNKTSRRLARKIFRKYGISSFILDEKMSVANLALFSHRFIRLSPASNTSITLLQLNEITKQLQDSLPILVPCSEGFDETVKMYRTELETKFVLSTTESILNNSPLSIISK